MVNCDKGKKNMSYFYSYDNLNKILKTQRGQKFIKNIELINQNEFESKPIFSLSYSKFKLIHTTGNRSLFENEYFDRRRRLCFLQMLSVYDDKYIEPLEDILAAICEEYTWVLPAHCARESNSFDYSEIDLNSAETAFYLSETIYVLNEKLSSDIKKRVKICLQEKIVKLFESRKFVFDDLENNWCAVCGAGVGITYLYAFPERFDFVKDRIFGLMQKYLKGQGEDGFCYEGVTYWQYGFAFFCFFFDVYTKVTGDYPDILNDKKVLGTINFITDAHLGGNKYLPYGDGGVDVFVPNIEMMCAVKSLFGDKFIEPNCEAEDFLKLALKPNRKGVGFRVISAIESLDKNRWKPAQEKTKYFESAEVFVYKNKNYAFTAQCGNNGYSHSHNDVGCFVIIKDDKRLIADLGAGLYTYEYFNDYEKRYGKEIFVCGSWSHSVPIVDGCPQKEEKEYYGKVLEVSDKNFKIDIAKAYNTPIKNLIVEYKINMDGVDVIYEYDDKVEHQITYRFVSDYKPQIKDGIINIEEVQIKCNKKIKFVIEAVNYKNRVGEDKFAYTIDFIADRKIKEKICFNFLVGEKRKNKNV